MRHNRLSLVLCLLSLGVFAVPSLFGEEKPTAPEVKKVAIFVKNNTKVPGMDDEVDGIRDRLAVAMAEVDGFVVLDASQIADSFRKYKVTAEEEKTGLVPGIFAGGSVPQVARMLGCDYIVAASIVGAGSMRRQVGEAQATVFNLRMSLKVMDATGASVYGVPVKPYTYPVTDAGDDPMNYYNILLDRWATEATTALATKAPKWRKPATAQTVAFVVSTTVDSVKESLESQTKGVSGEQLQELRKVVGGASVELDGALVGTAPCELRATPGLHQIRVRREWMKDYTATISVAEGQRFEIALEMSAEGVAKWGTVEALRAAVAQGYADAAWHRGIKVNVDTQNWRDVGGGPGVKVER